MWYDVVKDKQTNKQEEGQMNEQTRRDIEDKIDRIYNLITNLDEELDSAYGGEGNHPFARNINMALDGIGSIHPH